MIQHQVVEYLLLPDEREPLEKELKRLADQRQVHVIFTTGGTGFSVRDITPEATIAVCDRMANGIADAIRIGGDMIERSKPAPDIFMEACRQLNVLPEDSFIIEDSYNGIRAAHAAGAKAIMVPDLLQPTEEIRELVYSVQDSLVHVRKMLEQEINF